MISKQEILKTQNEIEAHAREMGFDFFPVIYEMVDYDTMSAVAAYGGFPSRYPHWSFGMEYDRLAKGYGYGLSELYDTFEDNEKIVTSEINDRDEILNAIKAFLGKGR